MVAKRVKKNWIFVWFHKHFKTVFKNEFKEENNVALTNAQIKNTSREIKTIQAANGNSRTEKNSNRNFLNSLDIPNGTLEMAEEMKWSKENDIKRLKAQRKRASVTRVATPGNWPASY